jgi:hypothetical protein
MAVFKLTKIPEEIKHKLQAEFTTAPNDEPFGDVTKAKRIVEILLRGGVNVRQVFYDYSGHWEKPRNFELFTAGEVIAMRPAEDMFGKINYKLANAYARLGYALSKFGVMLHGNMSDVVMKHRKGFPGFEKL